MLGIRLAVSALVALLATACSAPALKAAPRAAEIDAAPRAGDLAAVHPDPRVGAVFLGSDSVHTCTGAVLDSLAGNLIITAAHCLDAVAQPSWRRDGLYAAASLAGVIAIQFLKGLVPLQ